MDVWLIHRVSNTRSRQFFVQKLHRRQIQQKNVRKLVQIRLYWLGTRQEIKEIFLDFIKSDVTIPHNLNVTYYNYLVFGKK